MALLARKGFERVKVKSATSYLMLAVCVYLSCTDCFSVNSCSYLFEEPPFRHQQATVDFNTVNTHQRPSPSPSHLTANESIDISDQRWSSSYFFFLPQPLPTVFSWYWGEKFANENVILWLIFPHDDVAARTRMMPMTTNCQEETRFCGDCSEVTISSSGGALQHLPEKSVFTFFSFESK